MIFKLLVIKQAQNHIYFTIKKLISGSEYIICYLS